MEGEREGEEGISIERVVVEGGRRGEKEGGERERDF